MRRRRPSSSARCSVKPRILMCNKVMLVQRGSDEDPDWHGSPLRGWVEVKGVAVHEVVQVELRRARAANDRGPRRRRRAGEVSAPGDRT
eukprot:13167920-Alexandrium_andersonii.AAC.1